MPRTASPARHMPFRFLVSILCFQVHSIRLEASPLLGVEGQQQPPPLRVEGQQQATTLPASSLLGVEVQQQPPPPALLDVEGQQQTSTLPTASFLAVEGQKQPPPLASDQQTGFIGFLHSLHNVYRSAFGLHQGGARGSEEEEVMQSLHIPSDCRVYAYKKLVLVTPEGGPASLQRALDAAQPGDMITLSDGTYHGSFR